MSIDVMREVWKRAPYSGGTLLVFLALADWANDDGERVFPKIKQVAEKARLSIRGAQTAMRELEADGFLIPVNHSTGGRGKSSEYNINLIKLETMQILHGRKNPADRRTETPQIAAKNPADSDNPLTLPYIDIHQVNHQGNHQDDDDDARAKVLLSRICEILRLRLEDDPARVTWHRQVSEMLRDGLTEEKIIAATEVARTAGVPKLSYVRTVAFSPPKEKPNGVGNGYKPRESGHQQLARVSAELIDEFEREREGYSSPHQCAEPAISEASDERRAIPSVGSPIRRRPEGLQ